MIQERIQYCKNAARCIVGFSLTADALHHIPMVHPLSRPRYCTILMSTAVRKNHLPGISARSVEKCGRISKHTITHLKYILNWNTGSQFGTVFIAYIVNDYCLIREEKDIYLIRVVRHVIIP